MKIQVIGVLLVFVLIIPGLGVGHAVSPSAEEQLLLAEEVEIPEELTEEDVLLLLEAVTMDDIFTTLEDFCSTHATSPLFQSSLLKGIDQAERLGLRRSHTLRDIFSFLFTQKELTKHRWFLMSILPRRAVVNTYMQPMVINLTSVNTSFGEFPIQLELFVKTIPFLDRIQTTQYGTIRPQLTQKTVWWPAVGGRITFAGWFTLGILAFGPRIKWTRTSVDRDTGRGLL